MQKKVSVIIPAYNCERTIKRAIDSVVLQSYSDLELIVVNDGSNDGTKAIVETLALSDSRIRCLNIDNHGVSFARNFGIKNSTGNFIVFLDADDCLCDNFISRMIKGLDIYDFAMCGYSTVDKQGKKTLICKNFCGRTEDFLGNLDVYLEPPFLLGPCFKIFKRDIIISNDVHFPENLSFGEDAAFVIDYLKHTKQIKCLEFEGYIYFKENEKSLSSRFRHDKFNINCYLASKLDGLYDSFSFSGNRATTSFLFKRFVSFGQEIIIQKISIVEKKRIYYKNFDSSFLAGRIDSIAATTFSEKIVMATLKNRHLFFLLNLLRLCKK